MFFKVLKGTELFQKLDDLSKEMIRCNSVAFDLCKEMGFEEFHIGDFAIAGGLTAIRASEKPKGYKTVFHGKAENAYFPSNIKKNQDLLKKIADLPVVRIRELNEIFGLDSFFTNPGVQWREDYILLEFSDKTMKSFVPLPGMIEITSIEHKCLI